MTDWIERNRGYILVLLINLAVVGAAVVWMRRQDEPQLQIVSPFTPSPPAATATPQSLLRVYVTGEVVNPDVYRLPAGSIVKDAVYAAGGATAEADLTRINLAQEVIDQGQVWVPGIGESDAAWLPPGDRSATTSLAAVTLVNINTASVEELTNLPGIGPELAQRIVDWRTTQGEFQAIEDIKLVQGIGDSIFAQIKDRITVAE